jgi:cell surface protein SprA
MSSQIYYWAKYITDIRNTQVTLANGEVTDSRWIQFKIPVTQPENTIGIFQILDLFVL